jgi:hypothetical protein
LCVGSPIAPSTGTGFVPYVRQDYLFLIDYGRLLAVACARAPRLEWMVRFAEVARFTLRTRWICITPPPRSGVSDIRAPISAAVEGGTDDASVDVAHRALGRLAALQVGRHPDRYAR